MRIYGADIEIEESLVKILDKDERIKLARLAVSGNKRENREARTNLILSMTKFIIMIATKKYLLRGADLEEAVEESYLRLLVYFSPPAKSKNDKTAGFNPELGYDPITYAGHIIDSAIQRFVNYRKNTVTVPTGTDSRVRAFIRKLESKESISKKEFKKLLKEAGISEFLLAQYEHAHNPVSLDAPLAEDKDSTLIDVISDEENKDFSGKTFISHQLQKILQEASQEKLNEREIRALKLRYGLGDNIPYTYQAIGDMFGVTRERARQICLSAERKIKNWVEKKHPEYIEIIKHYLHN